MQAAVSPFHGQLHDLDRSKTQLKENTRGARVSCLRGCTVRSFEPIYWRVLSIDAGSSQHSCSARRKTRLESQKASFHTRSHFLTHEPRPIALSGRRVRCRFSRTSVEIASAVHRETAKQQRISTDVAPARRSGHQSRPAIDQLVDCYHTGMGC